MPEQLDDALRQTVTRFGGLDYLVLNAGIFPKSMSIKDMDGPTWDKCLHLNLTSQQQLLQKAIPYLELGIEPAVVFVGSKNVPAPGPGASAYSVAKAGLSQLGRVAAMELGAVGTVSYTHLKTGPNITRINRATSREVTSFFRILFVLYSSTLRP